MLIKVFLNNLSVGVLINFVLIKKKSVGLKITFINMGPKTTPSLISKGGYQIPPPLGGREIDTPWEIGLNKTHSSVTKRQTE